MKPLLLLATAALALSGCDIGNDCSFDSPPTREQRLEALAVVSLPDTVVVALVESPQFRTDVLGAVSFDPRAPLGGDSVRVRGSLTTRDDAPDLEARIDVRGDTVFVSLDAPLVRLACSPPPVPGEGFLDIALPEGVVVRRSVLVPQGPPRTSAERTSDPFRPLLRA